MHKEFVDEIYKEKAKTDRNSRDLAETLNVLSKTVFGEVNRFVFELLQNADDSSFDGNSINVQFELLENYLIFSHNGKHFNREDVDGISSIGNRASRKDQNAEKTGYKGIGFKSIFGSSDYAHIISGGFSFRFDKNYKGFKGSQDYPWQVIPIWTKKPPVEVSGHYDTERVNTIIRIGNRDVIREEIIKVFEDCQIILFLRKVNSITFFDRGEPVFKVSKSTADGAVELYNDNILISSWILKTVDLKISEELSTQLRALHDTECPKKLKEAKVTKLTFAAQVINKRLVGIERTVIYSYLPTKASKGFPFLINGDFLTNAERTELMSNIWNEFLFSEIAVRQLEWFRELQETEFRYEVLKLLNVGYQGYAASKIDDIYSNSLDAAKYSVEFLPEQANDGRLISIVNSVIDSAQFSELFDPRIITEYLGITDTHRVADLRLQETNTIISLGSRQFTFSHLLKLIATDVIADTLGATNLIVFFYNKTTDNQNISWLAQLGDAAFIMDESGDYKTPKEIFLPVELSEHGRDVGVGNLSYVNSAILSHFSDNSAVIEWLQDLGVREPTDLEVVKKALIPLILQNGINEENALNVTRFIFKVYMEKQLSDIDYESLKSLKLLTGKGLTIPSQCYLSDQYGPEKKLSAIIPNANFISDSYIENEEDIIEWKGLFQKIGVRQNISIDIIEMKMERLDFENKYPEAKPYFTWLENNNAYPPIYHRFRYSGQHHIQNFTAIEFTSHLSGVAFSKFFWGKMLDNWDTFKDKYSATRYYYLNGSQLVPSFVQYYVKNFAAIPCTDGKCYKSLDVYSPALKSIIGNYYPVADFSTSITVEQADFFGFKRAISTSECLDLLDNISEQPASSDLNKQIFAIYDQLISQSSSADKATRKRIANWRKTGNLLAINNTFQHVNDLFTFAVYETDVPVNSEYFLKLPQNLSFDEINALSNFLDIPVITFDLLEFVAIGEMEEIALQITLQTRAKFLALIYAHNNNENYSQVISRITTILKATRFLKAEDLSLIYKKDDGEILFSSKIKAWTGKKSEFYFTGNWSSPLTLYGLSNSICNLLGIQNMEREFGLIIQLEDKDTLQWLSEKGYKIDELSDEDLLSDNLVQSFVDDQYQEDSPFDGIDIDMSVKVSEIDFKNVAPVTKSYNDSFAIPVKEYKPIQNEQVKVDIGRWAEEYVFNYFNENPIIYSSVKWLNEIYESGMPYDFEVIENGITRFIEVKGTPSPTKEIVLLSEAEWRFLFKKGTKYSIFKVFGVFSSTNRLERTDDLKALISAGNLLTFPVQIVIG